jgi:mono/diheme cytochrome c family protein
MSGAFSTPQSPARLVFRRHARQLLRDPQSSGTHLARLQAATELPGAEPVQGALADLFVGLGPEQASARRAGLAMAGHRLAPHVRGWFEAQVMSPRVARISPLATRWSVLAVPTADMSTRARRCSPDDSRWLAAQVVQAVVQGDEAAQQAFLHHCVTCHDNLAFMLARRAVLKIQPLLPPAWNDVSAQLERGHTPG